MTPSESTKHPVSRGIGEFAGHIAAVIGGFILMFVGIGLGVGLVTLPLGIPIGFAGLAIFLWGLFGSSGAEK